MDSTPPRSSAVTAAATLAIAGSCVALVAWGWFGYHLFKAVHSFAIRGIPLKTREVIFVVAVAVLPPVLAILGFQTGVGLFRLSSWARQSALIWAWMSLLFCIYLLASNPYEILVIDSDHWSSELALWKQFFAQALLIALGPVSIWWIILFSSASVKAQFYEAQKKSARGA